MEGTNWEAMEHPDFVKAIPSLRDGLTVPQLENLLSDIRMQPIWRPEADKCADYYDNHQLDQEKLQLMEKYGIPPLITNLIAPAVDSVLGMEAKTRTDWRVTEEDEAFDLPQQIMDAQNVKLHEAERESRADRACSDSYAGQIKAGLGWVEVSRPVDAFAYPYRVQYVHRNEIWWDWRAKLLDLGDARYLVRKRRFDADELCAMMPEHAHLIRYAINEQFNSWQWETRETWDNQLAYAAYIERTSNLDSAEWRDGERKRATLFEVWYRKWCRGKVLRLPTGRVIVFRPNDPGHRLAAESGRARLETGVYAEVRVAFYLGPHRLYDMPSPYPHRHFPYVPFFGKREDRSGVPYGLIRAMISSQDVVNAADAKMHWMLNARRLTIDSDKLDTKYNTLRQVQEELARPDAVIVTDPSKPNSKIQVDTDFTLNQQQFQRRMQAASDINNSGGIYKALQGSETASKSGIALNSLIEQSSITLAEINDNAQFARRQVGELLFSLVREDLLKQETRVAIKKGRKKTIVILNQRVQDPATGQITIANNIAAVPTKVVLEDTPSTSAFRAQQLQIISEVTRALPPELQKVAAPFVIALTDAPNRDDIVDAMRKAGGLPDDLSDEEQAQADAQAQQEAQQAKEIALAGAVAQVKKTEGEAELAHARAQEIVNTPVPPPEAAPAADVAWQ